MSAYQRVTKNLILVAAIAGLLVACSGDGNQSPDGGANDGASGDGKANDGSKPDITLQPDLPPAKKPAIKLIIPASGPANAGARGAIPLTVIGENFTPAMTAYMDGQPINTPLKYTSSVSVSFTIRKNPYGDKQPSKVDIFFISGTERSNSVSFQYWVEAPATADRKGSILTATAKAFADFGSDPIQVKIYLKDLTDKTTGAPPAAKLKVEIGVGRVGDDPTKDYSFRWWPAKFEKDDASDDVFVGEVAPALKQTYDVAFRFSTDDGGTWTFVDKNDADKIYQPADAAKVNVGAAPAGYCKKKPDCVTQAYRRVCNLHATDWTKNICIECQTSADCTSFKNALGPTCNPTKGACGCASATDCKGNPNGKACTSGKYCGCTKDNDCNWTKGEKCVGDKINRVNVCRMVGP